ncbi:MAG: YfhO family protein [Oscillospiraceae bacterium]|nr:YfhO family protein [Oscillospiraceae bacterium]
MSFLLRKHTRDYRSYRSYRNYFNIHKGSGYFKVFVLAAVCAAVIFTPFVIYDNGIFLQYGDYNVQQIPFYQLANRAITDGNIWWNWNTDLGANFIGSYSFYLLGSPFFWLSVIFPPEFSPYLMMPLYVLKFAVAAVTSYAYIGRFIKNREYAVIGAFLYAFSSFQIYNIFFNHFHDVTALFPLLLIALEELVVNNRRGVFAVSAAMMCVVNYFFFFGQILFLIIYFFVRCFCKDFAPDVKKLLQIALEAVLGLAIAMFLLLPSILTIIHYTRIGSTLNGFDLIFYPDGNRRIQRYWLIFQSFFFPHDIAARPNLFSASESKWASVAAFLPLFSVSAVITYISQTKRTWMRRLLIICIIAAFIPGLNALFSALNFNYYARWFYMPILIMTLVTAFVLENKKYDLIKGIKWTAVIVGIFAVIGALPSKVEQADESEIIKFFSLPKYPDRYWINFAIAAAGIALIYFIVKKCRYKRKMFFAAAITSICLITVCYSIFALGWGRAQSFSREQVVDKGIYGAEKFNLNEQRFHRIDIYKGMDNWGMMWNMPTMQAFHSTVPVSIMNFYKSIGIDRSTASRPDIEYIPLRSLLSIRYLMAENTNKQKGSEMTFDGFSFEKNENGFAIFKNNNFVPIGFTYDYYCDDEIFDNYEAGKKDALLMKAMYLLPEDIDKYSRYLKLLKDDQPLYQDSRIELAKDSADRRNQTCYDFDINNVGFDAKINLSQSNLVFFSVPYDMGWSAEVNGKVTEIVQVNKGFMAVLAEAGSNTIRFRYTPPGLDAGIIISLSGILLLLIYVLTLGILAKKGIGNFATTSKRHKEFIRNPSHPIRSAAADEYINEIMKPPDEDKPPRKLKRDV